MPVCSQSLGEQYSATRFASVLPSSLLKGVEMMCTVSLVDLSSSNLLRFSSSTLLSTAFELFAPVAALLLPALDADAMSESRCPTKTPRAFGDQDAGAKKLATFF